MKRRPFLLLEILICFSLLSLCLYPLLKTTLNIRKSEAKRVERMVFAQRAENAFCHLKQSVYENGLPDSLQGKIDGAHFFLTEKDSYKKYILYEVKIVFKACDPFIFPLLVSFDTL